MKQSTGGVRDRTVGEEEDLTAEADLGPAVVTGGTGVRTRLTRGKGGRDRRTAAARRRRAARRPVVGRPTTDGLQFVARRPFVGRRQSDVTTAERGLDQGIRRRDPKAL